MTLIDVIWNTSEIVGMLLPMTIQLLALVLVFLAGVLTWVKP